MDYILQLNYLQRSLFLASRVINFRCLVFTNICSQYILQVPSGVEKAQFGIQSDQVQMMFRELTFWCLIYLFGQMKLTAPTPHYYWKFSEMTYSKYPIIVTNILSSIMLGSVVYFLIWSQSHSENESIIHIHRRGTSGKRVIWLMSDSLRSKPKSNPR